MKTLQQQICSKLAAQLADARKTLTILNRLPQDYAKFVGKPLPAELAAYPDLYKASAAKFKTTLQLILDLVENAAIMGDATLFADFADAMRKHPRRGEKGETVTTLLEKFPDKSSREIAKLAGTTHPHVLKIRRLVKLPPPRRPQAPRKLDMEDQLMLAARKVKGALARYRKPDASQRKSILRTCQQLNDAFGTKLPY